VDADDRLAQGTQGFETGVAEFEAELVFAFCVEGVVALVASGAGWALALFSYVNIWMDFERVHKISPAGIGACAVPDWDICLGCKERTYAGWQDPIV
jgi:hypothetical protein